MPRTVTVHVEGLRELGEMMRGLAAEMNARIARSATNAGAQVIKKRAIRNIETSPSIVTRSLHDAVIVRRIPPSRSQLTSEHIVTVRGKDKRKSKGKQAIAPHAHFVEFGTVNMPAEPFLRPAYDAGKHEARDAIIAKLRERLLKARTKAGL